MSKETESEPQTSAPPPEELQEAEVSFVSHSFRLEWRIPTKVFTDRNHVPRPMPKSLPLQETDGLIVQENSRLFEFKHLKIPPFNLVLCKYRWNDNFFKIKLISQSAGPALEYAFVIINERILFLSISDKSPIDYMKGKLFTPAKIDRVFKEQKYITVVCGIKAISDVSLSSSNKEVSKDSEDRLVWASAVSQGLPPLHRSTRWSTSTSTTGMEAFVKFFFCGELPSLNVDLAKDLLVVSSGKENAFLVALCVDYLTENLRADNVAGVLKVACELHEKHLMEKCHGFVSKYCRIVDTRFD